MDRLRIAIGDDDEFDIKILKGMLQSNGHNVICEDTDGSSLLRKIRSMMPDFVIAGYNMPGIKGLQIARIIQENNIAPVLLTAKSSEDVFVRKMGDEYFPYIIKPITEDKLLFTIEFVYNNFKKISTLQNEVYKLKNMLETRKNVERAKGILMDKYNMGEKDAFRYIQKRSMDECEPIDKIAKRIIENAKK
jgi:AmiR/NasT family two-component response regulator